MVSPAESHSLNLIEASKKRLVSIKWLWIRCREGGESDATLKKRPCDLQRKIDCDFRSLRSWYSKEVEKPNDLRYQQFELLQLFH